MTFLFEKLDVYQKSLELAKKVHTLTREISHREAHLADQARRAAASIPLNIAEGNGRWHKKERRNLFLIARGSCCECLPILGLLFHAGSISETAYSETRQELDTIARMLTGLINGIK